MKLRPRAAHYHALLDANGFNPLLALIVRGRQTLAFIRDHVERKWSVADADATRRCVATNSVEFHAATDDASPPLAYATTLLELARANSGTAVVELFYSWSLKLTPPMVLPTDSVAVTSSTAATAATTTADVTASSAAPSNVIVDDNSKRRRIRSPSASPRAAPPAFSSPVPLRALAASFTGDDLLQTVPLSHPPVLPSSSYLALLKRPARQPLLMEDSREVPLMGSSSIAAFPDQHDDLDYASGHSRHGHRW